MTASEEVQFDVNSILNGTSEQISTRYGPLTVTICGDTLKTPCLTYHDVGLNHRSCFTSLLVCGVNTSVLFRTLCFYHIDAPGSEENGIEVPKEALPMTMEKLADQVQDVIQHFCLENCLGMGVGAGGYILTLHAIKYPNTMIGLILLSSAFLKASWWEWTQNNLALPLLKFLPSRHEAIEYLTQRLISTKSTDLVHTVKTAMTTISTHGLYSYLKAVLNREDLSSRVQHLALKRLIVIWGYSALYKNDSLELNRAYKDKERSAWMECDGCGNLLTEECPFRILDCLQMFTRGLQQYGYL